MDNFYIAEENRALRKQRDELLAVLRTAVDVCGQVDLLLGEIRAAIARVEGRQP
jgi:hypothetical protein